MTALEVDHEALKKRVLSEARAEPETAAGSLCTPAEPRGVEGQRGDPKGGEPAEHRAVAELAKLAELEAIEDQRRAVAELARDAAARAEAVEAERRALVEFERVTTARMLARE